VICDAADFIERAYQSGTPMGGDIGPVRGHRGPRFAVLAMKDPGSVTFPGTDLQRVQIVKGWADAGGETHERVFDVAGSAANGAGVDAATCTPTGAGASQLCAVWQDPDFDPAQRAFYYVRVLENPTCRWSTLVCKSLGVDPLSPNCEAQAALAGDFENCCLDESNDPFMQPIIQERAWTSPIWVRPEAVTSLNAKIRRAGGSRDRVEVKLDIGSIPSGFDPTGEDLTLRISDDDEIYTATLPAGSLQVDSRRGFRFRDPTGALNGLRRATFRIAASGAGRVVLAAAGLDLANADMTDHMVRVDLTFGAITAERTRLWSTRDDQLQVQD
jgi:hypothetical protein